MELSRCSADPWASRGQALACLGTSWQNLLRGQSWKAKWLHDWQVSKDAGHPSRRRSWRYRTRLFPCVELKSHQVLLGIFLLLVGKKHCYLRKEYDGFPSGEVSSLTKTLTKNIIELLIYLKYLKDTNSMMLSLPHRISKSCSEVFQICVTK